ncbi:Hypp8212 [Branchiostoma lanceolatum]|uniref:Hypp8212 protein n=1 Tax=Branchiostoma lanceolatum TaxID=7740 RepID=A0A8J9Z7Q7_BRALA|nr:Hypp8212 [Branchiostoma lanceolatum]
MNFVKGMKAVRQLPADFEERRDIFHEQIKEAIAQHNILDDMVVNFDQTGVQSVPSGEWTLEEAGARQVSIVGLEDKRQITVPLTISLAGQLRPPQVLYQGKTEKCHPKFPFPEEWDIRHTASHWSTEESMCYFVDTIIAPYMTG